MIKFYSTKTGQSIGSVTLKDGDVGLSPSRMREVMKALADSDIGHLVEFEFDGTRVSASCVFGERARKDIQQSGDSSNDERSDPSTSGFSPLG